MKKKSFPQVLKILKNNESQYIALFVVSGSIRKLFSIDMLMLTFLNQ